MVFILVSDPVYVLPGLVQAWHRKTLLQLGALGVDFKAVWVGGGFVAFGGGGRVWAVWRQVGVFLPRRFTASIAPKKQPPS